MPLQEISWLTYGLWPPLLLFALWWLVRGGRPAAGSKRQPYPQPMYTVALTITVLLFGFTLGPLPNPVAALVAFFPWAATLPGAADFLPCFFSR